MVEATCHCGAVRFSLAHAPATVTDCNCSICRRYGVLWAYYTSAQVEWPEPAGPTQVYLWGEHRLQFHRCAACGCVTHWRPTDPSGERRGVNARLLPPDILAAAHVRHLDGAHTWQYLD